MNDAALDKSLSLIKEFVSIDTTQGQPTLPVVQFIETIFDAHEIPFEKTIFDDNAHGVLLGRIGPELPGGCLLSAHVDVVSVEGQEWETDPFKVFDDGQKLYGRGTCDMKGFIGAVLSLIPFWQQQKISKPVYLAFTCDEETEMKSVKELVKFITPQNKPDFAILGEPTGMKIVSAHKGAQDFQVTIQGTPAHSSRPELGINAITVAGEIISFVNRLGNELREITRNELFQPPCTTVNVGKISGGTAVNVVPAHCILHWQSRPILNKQADEIRGKFREFLSGLVDKHAGVALRIEEVFIPALEPQDDNIAVKIAQIASNEVQSQTASFASEAGIYQAAGIDTIVCGPGHIEQAHGPNEFIEIYQIMKCLEFLRALPLKDIDQQHKSNHV